MSPVFDPKAFDKVYDPYSRCKYPTACRRPVEYEVKDMGTFLMWQHTLCQIHLEMVKDPAIEAAWRMGGLAAVRAMGGCRLD